MTTIEGIKSAIEKLPPSDRAEIARFIRGWNPASPLEELNPDIQAATERAEAQSARGEGHPWQEVKKELQAKPCKE